MGIDRNISSIEHTFTNYHLNELIDILFKWIFANACRN